MTKKEAGWCEQPWPHDLDNGSVENVERHYCERHLGVPFTPTPRGRPMTRKESGDRGPCQWKSMSGEVCGKPEQHVDHGRPGCGWCLDQVKQCNTPYCHPYQPTNQPKEGE